MLDFLRARRAGNGDGDGNGGTPVTCALRSFSADTPVLLADGSTKPIADVVVGDLVFAQDPETGLSGPRAVTATWPHTDTLVEFEVGDGTVVTTEDHEFWNVTDQAWQETQHIDAGDLLLTADGLTVEAGNLLWDTAHDAPAFDLTIDGIHTYHVTASHEQVLVHNNTPCTDLGDDWTQAPASEIPGSTECEACAEDIVATLGEGAQIVRIEVPSVRPQGTPFTGTYRGQDSGWVFHEVVIQEGRVFDAFGPRNGVPVDDWFDLWEGLNDLDLEAFEAFREFL